MIQVWLRNLFYSKISRRQENYDDYSKQPIPAGSGTDRGSEAVRQREFDQYIPKKAEEEKSYGHYEVVPDGEGHSKVRFDNPQKDLEEKISADQVKTEDSSSLGQGPKLQKLKKKQQQLKQKLRSETDAGKTEELKRKLVQIEREIRAAEK